MKKVADERHVKDKELEGNRKEKLEESKRLLKEAEKKEAEVRKVMKENVEADAAHKIEERLDEVKAMIGKVTAKSGEVKELVQPKAEEGKGEVLASKDVNVADPAL